jgi:hypothetical protein
VLKKIVLVLFAVNTARLFAEEPDYFPSALGNYWKYSNGSVTKIIGEKNMADGVLARTLKTVSGCVTCNDKIFESYMSKQNNGIKIYYSQDETAPSYLIKYPCVVGSFWLNKSGTQYDTSRIVGFETVITPMDTFNNCLKLELRNNDLICTEWYAPGVGMVKFVDVSDTLMLQEYTVTQ